MSGIAMIVVAAGVAASSVLGPPAHVLYVDAGATGVNNGSSWADAYTDLQDALADARTRACSADTPCRIWAAAGVYRPDRGTGDPEAAFELLDHLGIYGGFAGGETRLDQRDWLVNQTILSGDLLGNDDPAEVGEGRCCDWQSWEPCTDHGCWNKMCDYRSACCDIWWEFCTWYAQAVCCDLCRPTRCDNTYQVVRAVGPIGDVVLDGLTISGGDARGEYPFSSGGGLYVREAGVTLRHCTFTHNAALAAHAVSLDGAPSSLTKCTFSENGWPGAGSDTVFSHRELAVTDCVFVRNRSTGLVVFDSQEIVRCAFVENAGRGLVLFGGAPNVIDCTFVGNADGGAANATAAQFINCGFYGNSAGVRGGGCTVLLGATRSS